MIDLLFSPLAPSSSCSAPGTKHTILLTEMDVLKVTWFHKMMTQVLES
jgi:hypothetical protein